MARPKKHQEETRYPSTTQARLYEPLAALVVVAAIVAYHNSFSGTFILDDVRQIVEEQRLQNLGEPWAIISHSRRPVVDLSFAVNYAVDGLNVRGYHAVNLAVHIMAALTLFAVVRRTLLSERLAARFKQASPWLALTAALIWTVHPLTTQSVTYVIQRCESMMGLFYLLTIYCAVRGADSPRPAGWYALAVCCCGLGMASKAVMITAPLFVLLYDRIFIFTSLRQALSRRWGLYLGLAVTWSILGACGIVRGVLHPGNTPATVGFGTEGITPLEYLATQPGVILHYLRLSLWPHPLCLDYAWPVARNMATIVPAAGAVGVLLGLTVAALRWKPALGFLGAWFFMVLSPTSSFIPIRDRAFEHRMYLPLAAVVVLAVVAGDALLRFLARRLSVGEGLRGGLAGGLVAVMVIAATSATIRRNRVYQSKLIMWTDVLAQSPNNARAQLNLGRALADEGQTAEAIQRYQAAIRLAPGYHIAHYNLGTTKLREGDFAGAIPHYETAVRIKPDYTEAHVNWAICLDKLGRRDEAISRFRSALQTRPPGARADAIVRAHFRLGNALAKKGELDQAIEQYQQGLEISPTDYAARSDLGLTLAQAGQLEEAISQYRQALRIGPHSYTTHYNLGNALLRLGQPGQAVSHYAEAVRLKPDHAKALINWANALLEDKREDEAIARFRAALETESVRAQPDLLLKAHVNLGNALFGRGELDQAITEYRQALRIRPDHFRTHYNLGLALQRQDRIEEAIQEYRETLRLEPDHAGAKRALATLGAASRHRMIEQ